MKRSFIALGICATLLCSCKLDNGSESRHDVTHMQNYTWEMLTSNVLIPAETVNSLMMLDEYMAAGKEERQGDAFAWHRENIFQEDETTFFIENFGTVDTRGKRLAEADSQWEVKNGNIIFERTSEDSWKFTKVFSYQEMEISTTVTYTGKDSKGRNTFNVEAYSTDTCTVSRHSGKTVNAILFTGEGGMTIINPLPYSSHYNVPEPEGSGIFRIETDTDGSSLDWMEFRYYNGKDLVFNCSLISNL